MYPVGFKVLTAVSTKMAVFWLVAPCTDVSEDCPDDGGSEDI
jgi:hypothetical protein